MTASGPVSAFAARKARQQLAPNVAAAKTAPEVDSAAEPPSKRPRRSLEGEEATGTSGEKPIPRTRAAKKQVEPLAVEMTTGQSTMVLRSHKGSTKAARSEIAHDSELEDSVDSADELNEGEIASVAGDADGYESPADIPAVLQNFPLSKVKLNKGNIVYSDESTLCVRIQEKMVRNIQPC